MLPWSFQNVQNALDKFMSLGLRSALIAESERVAAEARRTYEEQLGAAEEHAKETAEIIANLQRLERRLHDAIEHKRCVHQHREPHDLQPLECLPSQAKGYHPYEKGTTRVNDRTRRGTYCPCDGKPKEIESPIPGSISEKLLEVHMRLVEELTQC